MADETIQLHGQYPGGTGKAVVFCIVGGHPVEQGTEWKLVRASVAGENLWRRDESSAASIPCCKDCESKLL